MGKFVTCQHFELIFRVSSEFYLEKCENCAAMRLRHPIFCAWLDCGLYRGLENLSSEQLTTHFSIKHNVMLTSLKEVNDGTVNPIRIHTYHWILLQFSKADCILHLPCSCWSGSSKLPHPLPGACVFPWWPLLEELVQTSQTLTSICHNWMWHLQRLIWFGKKCTWLCFPYRMWRQFWVLPDAIYREPMCFSRSKLFVFISPNPTRYKRKGAGII